MSVVSGLHTGEIDCLVSRLVDEIRWLGVFARDEVSDVTRDIRPCSLILKTDPKIRQELIGSLSMHLCLVALNYLIHLAFFLACIVLMF